MRAAELLSFMRAHPLAVQASVSADGEAQAAVVGIVVTDEFEVFFDTSEETRKVANLRRNPRIAFVIGGTSGMSARCSTRALPTSPGVLSSSG